MIIIVISININNNNKHIHGSRLLQFPKDILSDGWRSILMK